jgi:hypothetical protein
MVAEAPHLGRLGTGHLLDRGSIDANLGNLSILLSGLRRGYVSPRRAARLDPVPPELNDKQIDQQEFSPRPSKFRKLNL